MKTKNGQPLRIIVHKLENSPISSNILTKILHSKAQTQYSTVQNQRHPTKTRNITWVEYTDSHVTHVKCHT